MRGGYKSDPQYHSGEITRQENQILSCYCHHGVPNFRPKFILALESMA